MDLAHTICEITIHHSLKPQLQKDAKQLNEIFNSLKQYQSLWSSLMPLKEFVFQFENEKCDKKHIKPLERFLRQDDISNYYLFIASNTFLNTILKTHRKLIKGPFDDFKPAFLKLEVIMKNLHKILKDETASESKKASHHLDMNQIKHIQHIFDELLSLTRCFSACYQVFVTKICAQLKKNQVTSGFRNETCKN
ncbi:hypothetical protein RF11_05361 [Thelohanellus kitauei]|uniref:Uncharacterized protein n=1 Tax=Thelohanellus kitauei TaxID=669202 RepID=A0A0C2M6K4_THEKT|nr:hypothetical protein RF11_05361 [Thelohanellus kitauei]